MISCLLFTTVAMSNLVIEAPAAAELTLGHPTGLFLGFVMRIHLGTFLAALQTL